MRISLAHEPKQKKIQGISNRTSWPIKLSCQCKINCQHEERKSLQYIFFWLKCHQTHFLTLVNLLMAECVLLQQAPPFKTTLRFKELRLSTKNCSCRLDIIADLHQQCYHI